MNTFLCVVNWWVRARVYESMLDHQDDRDVHAFLFRWMWSLKDEPKIIA